MRRNQPAVWQVNEETCGKVWVTIGQVTSEIKGEKRYKKLEERNASNKKKTMASQAGIAGRAGHNYMRSIVETSLELLRTYVCVL